MLIVIKKTMDKFSKSARAIMRMLVETLGIGVGLACILWVLGQLIVSFHGYVFVGENNKFVLLTGVTIVTIGMFCFLMTFCLGKLPRRMKESS